MASVVAIDWSGREKGAEEAIWLAHVAEGELRRLENGWTRGGVVDEALAIAGEHGDTTIGLDFAFSFPRWYVDERGWGSGREVWEAMGEEAESLLRGCEPPFWGRSTPRPAGLEMLRETEKPLGAKSVFQIGGAGAVGTGSLRGMKHLATLAREGCSVWPFDPPGGPRVVEIYPRLLTGAVNKSRHRARVAYLCEHFDQLADRWRERAAGSQDAFDAAVSALVMASHADELAGLEPAPAGSAGRLEGEIWRPVA